MTNKGVGEAWLKRCLKCGGLNQPLATKCEHCIGSGFEWKIEDAPPRLDVTPLTGDPPPRGEEHAQARLYHATLSQLAFCGEGPEGVEVVWPA